MDNEMTRYTADIKAALDANPKCRAGAFGSLNVYYSCGWGDLIYPEILAMLHMDDSSYHFWYGYISPSYKEKGTFIALIVRTHRFVNTDKLNILGAFKSTFSCSGGYDPCKIQHEDDAYKECLDLPSAVEALTTMIKRFDFYLRAPDISSPHYMDHIETRIYDHLGFSRWP